MKKALSIILLSILLCTAFIPCAAFAAGGVPETVLDLRQSVVRVICQTSDGKYTGSGFAIGTEEPIKYIVTNLHVVEQNINGVTILRENNREIPAKVYLQIEHADLCVLLLDEALYGVPPVKLADGREAAVGQAVYALGFPGAADDLSDEATGDSQDVTITDGIISAIKSLTLTQDGTPINLLQINAAISHGNSGGPLVDENGHVLGINSLGSTESQNINGAISILELTGALRERGIAYLSASDGKAGFPLMTVVITSASVLVVAATLLTILLVRRARKKNKAKQATPAVAGIPLPQYLKQWGGRLPYDMASRMLAPVLRELASLHAAGKMHGDICPENISVDPNSVQAALHAPEASAQGGKLVLRPGFSAPEQYRADGRLGLWTDVYSMCAVLYYIVTGHAPRGVMERMAQGSDSFDLERAGIDESHAAALFAGLALDAVKRPQSAAELAAALNIDLGEIAPAVPAIAEPAAAKPAKKRMKTGKKVLIAALATLFMLCAGAGGYYLYLDNKYNSAIECIQKQDYKGGIANLLSILRGFKSADEWMNYACAGNAMQQNDFYNARLGFTRVGFFNNAQDMLKEVDYLEAYYLLAKGDYDRAKTLFTALGKYKESEKMITETDYQHAMDYLANKQFINAKTLFEALGEYKESKIMIIECDYQKALSCMSEGKYMEATDLFSVLYDLNYKNSGQLLLESGYQDAIRGYVNKQYIYSFNILKNILEFKDSSYYMGLVKEAIYNEAIQLYRQAKYEAAKPSFELLENYMQSFDYYTLIIAHTTYGYGVYENDSTARKIYNHLKSLGRFEDALSIRSSDFYIYYRLEGKWQDDNGKYLQMKFEKGLWYLTCTLPAYDGDYYMLKDCIISYGNDKKGWKKAYKLTFISEDRMSVYCYRNKRTYDMGR